MNFIGAEISGVENLISDFKGYEKEAVKAIDMAVKETAANIESDAKKRLRGMFGSAKHWITGRLAASIYNRKVKDMEKVVGTDVEYAPYIEFGTGDMVFENFDFDKEAKGVAADFKGKGIRKVNIKGDSFLNWAAVNQQEKLVDRIESNLNKINR
jgi:phage gpG-like protein